MIESYVHNFFFDFLNQQNFTKKITKKIILKVTLIKCDAFNERSRLFISYSSRISLWLHFIIISLLLKFFVNIWIIYSVLCSVFIHSSRWLFLCFLNEVEWFWLLPEFRWNFIRILAYNSASALHWLIWVLEFATTEQVWFKSEKSSLKIRFR